MLEESKQETFYQRTDRLRPELVSLGAFLCEDIIDRQRAAIMAVTAWKDIAFRDMERTPLPSRIREQAANLLAYAE